MKEQIVTMNEFATPETIAVAVASRSEEWREGFLRELLRHCPKLFWFREMGVESPSAEIGDFGVSPDDSKQLLELRQAIDSYLGWPTKGAEEAGDYVGRVREIGDALPMPPGNQEGRRDVSDLDEELQHIDDVLRQFGFDPETQDAVAKALGKQRETIHRQRRELRFLNKREEDRSKFAAFKTRQHLSSDKAIAALCADLDTLAKRAALIGDESCSHVLMALRILRENGHVTLDETP